MKKETNLKLTKEFFGEDSEFFLNCKNVYIVGIEKVNRAPGQAAKVTFERIN